MRAVFEATTPRAFCRELELERGTYPIVQRDELAVLAGVRGARFLTLRYIDGLTLREIGWREGVQPERVRQLLDEAVTRMIKAYGC